MAHGAVLPNQSRFPAFLVPQLPQQADLQTSGICAARRWGQC